MSLGKNYEYLPADFADYLSKVSKRQQLLDAAINAFLSNSEKLEKIEAIKAHFSQYAGNEKHSAPPTSPRYRGPKEDVLPFLLYEMLEYCENRNSSKPGLLNVCEQHQSLKMETSHLAWVLDVLARSFFEQQREYTRFTAEVIPQLIGSMLASIGELRASNEKLTAELAKLKRTKKGAP